MNRYIRWELKAYIEVKMKPNVTVDSELSRAGAEALFAEIC